MGKDEIKALGETDFYKKQVRVALRNCGVINPESLDEYIAMDGYQALAKCLTEYTPEQVIQVVTDSGLRGRGGGGFPKMCIRDRYMSYRTDAVIQGILQNPASAFHPTTWTV